MAQAPGEDGRGEHVVEDLEADATRVVRGGDRAEDARTREAVDHLADLLLRRSGVLRQVVEAVGDLRPGGSDEVVEDARRLVPLVVGQRPERALEVLGDDPLRSAESRERREPEGARAGRPLLLPEALHDELEIRRLDPSLACGRDPAAAHALVDPTGLDLVEHGLDELGVDSHRLAAELAVALDRTDDRLAPSLPIEMVEPQVVAEEVRDPGLERVELRQRVLPQAEQEVRPQPGLADRRGQLTGEAGPEAVALVEEVLLELVEDHVDVPLHDPRRGPQRVGERPAAFESDRLLDRLVQAAARVTGPGREHDDRGVVDGADRVGDRGPEQRRLPDPARAVQDREPRGHQIGDDDLPLALAAEEEEGVELGVLERRQPLERPGKGLGSDAHRPTAG